MRRALLTAVQLCLAFGAHAIPQGAPQALVPQSQRTIPCKTPENASMCYWTRGRLLLTTGWSRWQLWKIGTNRILFIYGGPAAFPARTEEDRTAPEFPANLERAYQAEVPRLERLKKAMPDWVYADFEVCPLEPEEPGLAQAACIESARNVFFDGSKKMYP